MPHTPEPWEWDTVVDGNNPVALYGRDRAVIELWPRFDLQGRLSVVMDIAPADRVLLAAAPRLLSALRGLADCAGISALPGYKQELDDAMREARAALAEAEESADEIEANG
jgi:hypothetical protein